MTWTPEIWQILFGIAGIAAVVAVLGYLVKKQNTELEVPAHKLNTEENSTKNQLEKDNKK